MVLSAGAVLAGRFRILNPVHRSGMSTMYRAIDVHGEFGIVAIREVLLHDMPVAEQVEARDWLAREAVILATLHHPSLPELLTAFGEQDNRYIVMPFYQGTTLKELVANGGPLSETQVGTLAVSLAGVLEYLHQQKPPIIHRDVKPENIVVRSDGEIMLLDFGIARPLGHGGAGTAIGTPGYASPEQYQGFADARSDLYGLGATMLGVRARRDSIVARCGRYVLLVAGIGVYCLDVWMIIAHILATKGELQWV